MSLSPVVLGTAIGTSIAPGSTGHYQRHTQTDQGLLDLADRVNSILGALPSVALLSASQTFTGTQTLTPASSGTSPLILKGVASQSVPLLSARDSSNAILAQILAEGTIQGAQFLGPNFQHPAQTGTFFALTAAGAVLYIGRAAAQPVMQVLSTASQTASIQEWTTNIAVVLSKIRASGEYENVVAASATTDALGGTGGIVLKSPNGTRWRLTVTNAGGTSVVAA